MNWNRQDAATMLGGGVIPFGVALLSSSLENSSVRYIWFRVSVSIIAAMVSALISYSYVLLVTARGVGHKKLNTLALVYFFSRTVVHAWVAWRLWHGQAAIPLVVSTLSTFTEVLFGLYFFGTQSDLALTYRRSEEQRIWFENKIADIQQASAQLKYVTELQRANITNLEENVGQL